MSEFTPVPWNIILGRNYFSIEDIRQKDLATVWYDPIITMAEAEANARLIASAPDMYEALQACIYELERHNGNFDSHMDETMDFDGEIEKVRKALAKAEGKV